MGRQRRWVRAEGDVQTGGDISAAEIERRYQAALRAIRAERRRVTEEEAQARRRQTEEYSAE